MFIILKSIVIIISACFFIIGTFSCIQEDLRRLLMYTIMGHCGYLIIIMYNVITSHPMSHEFLNILFFYLFFIANVTIGFFYCVLSMKRNGNTYQVKSIYDLAQLWLINKQITLCLFILLFGLSGFPLFPGFTCKWFLVQESFQFNKVLGIISFFMSIFSAYPYLRIMNHMILNKNLMLNKKGPRWYFDNLLSTPAIIILLTTSFLCIIATIKPSIIWFFIHHLPLYIYSIYELNI